MTTFTRGARVGALVISVVLLLLVPGIAAATFSGRRAAPLDVSTATMVAPTAVTGTYACTRGGANEAISITVSDFTDAGPTGSQYLYTLRLGTSVKATSTSATRSATLSFTQLAGPRVKQHVDDRHPGQARLLDEPGHVAHRRLQPRAARAATSEHLPEPGHRRGMMGPARRRTARVPPREEPAWRSTRPAAT